MGGGGWLIMLTEPGGGCTRVGGGSVMLGGGWPIEISFSITSILGGGPLGGGKPPLVTGGPWAGMPWAGGGAQWLGGGALCPAGGGAA